MSLNEGFQGDRLKQNKNNTHLKKLGKGIKNIQNYCKSERRYSAAGLDEIPGVL